MSTFLDYLTSLRNIQKIFLRLLSGSILSSFANWALLMEVKPFNWHVQNRTLSQYQSPSLLSLQFCPSHPKCLLLRVTSTYFYYASPPLSSDILFSAKIIKWPSSLITHSFLYTGVKIEKTKFTYRMMEFNKKIRVVLEHTEDLSSKAGYQRVKSKSDKFRVKGS